MRKLKKGFTIIELVIVIAVIAVLTAVLVPTFVHLSKKARDTNDKSVVTSANIQLAAQEGLQGKNRSMSEAVKDVDEIGYHMSTVPTGNGNKIVWDSVTDRFVLLDKDNNVLLSDGEVSSHDKLFYAVSSLDERGDFAVYAKSGYSGTTTFTSDTGIFSFDAGDKDDIELISYTFSTAGNVLVATNSADTVLSVDAPYGEFTHAGLCGKILLAQVKGDTFAEHGKIGYVKLTSGHYVADAGSNVKAIYVSDNAGKVDRLNGGVIENAYGKDNTVTNAGHNVPLDTTGAKTESQIEKQAMSDLDHDINPAPADPYAALVAQIESDPLAATATYAAVVQGETEYVFDSIPEAIVGQNITIIMLKADSVDFNYVMNANYTLDANGHEVTFYGDGVGIADGGTVTFKDNKGSGRFSPSQILLFGSGYLVIESGNFYITGPYDMGFGPIGGYGGTVVIRGGTFNCDPTQWVDTSAYDVAFNGSRYSVTAK